MEKTAVFAPTPNASVATAAHAQPDEHVLSQCLARAHPPPVITAPCFDLATLLFYRCTVPERLACRVSRLLPAHASRHQLGHTLLQVELQLASDVFGDGRHLRQRQAVFIAMLRHASASRGFVSSTRVKAET